MQRRSVSVALDEADLVRDMRRTHREIHRIDHRREIDVIRAEMSRRIAGEDRRFHDRMHDACPAITNERNNT